MQKYNIKTLKRPSFQRALAEGHPIFKAAYDEGREGAIVVWHHDGELYTLDGMHRVEAKRRSGASDEIWGTSFYGTLEEAALEFVRLNKARKGLTALDLYGSELAAKTSRAVVVQDALRANGYAAVLKKSAARTRCTSVTPLLNDSQLAQRALWITSTAFPEQEPHARFLTALIGYLKLAKAATITDEYIATQCSRRFRTMRGFVNANNEFAADEEMSESASGPKLLATKLGVSRRTR